MEKIDIVNLFIKHPTEKKFVAVLRSSTDDTYGEMWALPGGKVEEGEDITAAARRELYEETGTKLLTIDLIPLINVQFSSKAGILRIGLFEAKIVDAAFLPQYSDITEVKWIDSNTLLESFRMHKYPEDQIKLLEKFFSSAFK